MRAIFSPKSILEFQVWKHNRLNLLVRSIISFENLTAVRHSTSMLMASVKMRDVLDSEMVRWICVEY